MTESDSRSVDRIVTRSSSTRPSRDWIERQWCTEDL